jgi:hypothetical protein
MPVFPNETRLDFPSPTSKHLHCSASTSRIVTPITRPTMSASRGYAKRRTWHFDFGPQLDPNSSRGEWHASASCCKLRI